MMGHTCDLETVEPQELPIKVCVLFCNVLSDELYRNCRGKKLVFLHSFDLNKCIASCRLVDSGMAI